MNELGNIIQSKRLSNHLNIEDISNALKISKNYVKALEEGQVNAFATKAYYYGYLKQYLKLLKLDHFDIIEASTEAKFNINSLRYTNFKPSFLLITISIIATIFIYCICSSFINANSIDPIALEFKNNPSKFAKMDQ